MMLEPQFVTAIASTVMATIVSVVALIFNFRQNVGWKPVGLVTESKMSGTGGGNRYAFVLTVEFWNRRKYPVALRHLSAKVTGFKATDRQETAASKFDHVRKNTIFKQTNALVSPHGSHEIVVEVEFENQSLDAMKPLFDIELGYFDPLRERTKALKLQHKFFYPHLGWMKSKAEIDDAFSAFVRIQTENTLREEVEAQKATSDR